MASFVPRPFAVDSLGSRSPVRGGFSASLIVWSSLREGATATLSFEAINTVRAAVDSRTRTADVLFSG